MLFSIEIDLYSKNGIIIIIYVPNKRNIKHRTAITIYFRMFSKNLSKRYQERNSFLEYSSKFKAKQEKRKRQQAQRKSYAFFKCPSCKQKVRVPKGKGKISIHCPKCGVDFIKKS